MIREWASGLYTFLGDAFGTLFSYLVSLFTGLFGGLKDLLVTLFTPVLQLISAIFYFLYKLGLLIVDVIEILFRFVFFFVYVMKGLFLTLIGLSYNGRTAELPERYQTIIHNLQPALDFVQMDKIAVLCLWAVWVFVAIALIKVVGARN